MERFLEMHMYITSALQKTDMKAVGLQLALDLLHERVSSIYSFILVVKNSTILRPPHKKRHENLLYSKKLDKRY